MKLFTFLTVLLFAVALFTQGCVMIDSSLGLDPIDRGHSIVGSGHLVTLTPDFKNFKKIYLSHSFRARIEKGSASSVKIETDDNIEQYVRASQTDDEIHIGLEDNSYSNVTLTVVIVTPDLSLINVSGAASVTLNGFNLSHSLEIVSSGSCILNGTLNAADVVMKLSGGTIVNFTGGADDLQVEGSGGTVLRLLNFPVKTCKASLSGGSVSDVSVSDTLEVTLSGGSVFRYRGNPVMRLVSVSGGSTIQRLY